MWISNVYDFRILISHKEDSTHLRIKCVALGRATPLRSIFGDPERVLSSCLVSVSNSRTSTSYDSAFATPWTSQWWVGGNPAENNCLNSTEFGSLLIHQFFPGISLHSPSLELILNFLYWSFTSNIELSPGLWAALT